MSTAGLPPPSEVAEIFKPLETLGLSWGGFMLTQAHEKRKIFKKLKTKENVRNLLEDALCEDMRSLDIFRTDYEEEIAKAVKKATEPDPLPVGLKNQSSTCYLNAMLQALYHVTYFRNLIYQMPVEPDMKPDECIALALQRIFFNLQTRQKLVTTKELTNAFGWDVSTTTIQHDVQEFLKKLLEELEDQMKETEELSGAIPRMMKGSMLYGIHCLDAPHVSNREEVFYDLELTVKGNESMEASLKAFCATEKFDFKYEYEHPDGTKSKHDAERRTSFKHMPAILMTHPNRVAFDMEILREVAIQDRWTFPNEFDFGPYMDGSGGANRATSSANAAEGDDQPLPNSKCGTGVIEENEEDAMQRAKSEEWCRSNSLVADQSTQYVLNSVVIHTGGAGFGHYYIVVKDGDRWIKINDETASVISQQEMENLAFGGKRRSTDSWGRVTEYPSATKCAYLVYVNKALLDKIIYNIDTDKLPGYLHAGLEEQFAAEAAREEQRQRDQNSFPFASVGVSTDPSYLYDFADKDKRKSIKVLKDGTVEDLAKAAHAYYKLPEDKKVHCWFYHEYYTYGETYRSNPALFHLPGERLKTTAIGCLAGTSEHTRKLLFCNVVDADAEMPTNRETAKLLHVSQFEEGGKIRFVKVFESTAEFVNHLRLNKEPKVVYTAKNTIVKPITKLQDVVSGHQLVVCPPGTKESTVSNALDVMYNSVEITLYRLGEDGEGQEIGPLIMTEKTQFSTIQENILNTLRQRREAGVASEGELLDELPESPDYIGLRKHDSNSEMPHRFLASRTSSYYKTPTTVKDLCSSTWAMIPKIYYNILPSTYEKIEKNWLECVYSVGEVVQTPFYINLNKVKENWGTVFDQVREQFKERLVDKYPDRQLRSVVLYAHTRVDKEYISRTAKTPGSWTNTIYFFEELPEKKEEVDVDMEEGKLLRMDVVNVCRASGGEDFHGTPTCIYVNAKDTGKTLLEKIVDKLEVPEDQRENALKHWRVLYRASSTSTTMIKPDELAYPTVKSYTGGTMSFSQFLMVDRYPKSACSNKAKKAAPKRRHVEHELKIKSQKSRKAEREANNSPQPEKGEEDEGAASKKEKKE